MERGYRGQSSQGRLAAVVLEPASLYVDVRLDKFGDASERLEEV